ncbi:MAG: hypothetical protein KatS3mg110_4039 [Pirellulaceae bacterium]|nr:MAG: hypothetical protein KatS3mg110_4039 [Pirellulaceae bacterium]
MRPYGWWLFFAAILWWGTAAAAAAEGEYWVLAVPSTFRVSVPPAQVRLVPKITRPYAYGWFGAQPRRHAAIHLGYRQNYFQWSLQ